MSEGVKGRGLSTIDLLLDDSTLGLIRYVNGDTPALQLAKGRACGVEGMWVRHRAVEVEIEYMRWAYMLNEPIDVGGELFQIRSSHWLQRPLSDDPDQTPWAVWLVKPKTPSIRDRS